jgi:hypothetical protein
MFKYDWSLFNTKLGLIFMAGLIVVYGLTGRFELSMMAAGISALLAWCTIILAPGQTWLQHSVGLLVYPFVGAALTWVVFGAAVIGQSVDLFTGEVVVYALLSLTIIRVLPVFLSLSGSGESVRRVKTLPKNSNCR